MANKKITDLPDSTGITDNDLFAVGDKGGTSLVKAKWSAIWTKISASIIEKLVVNNLVTTAAGLLLDARQGKALNDKFTELNTKINATFPANDKIQSKDGTVIVYTAKENNWLFLQGATDNYTYMLYFSTVGVYVRKLDNSGNIISEKTIATF